VTRALAALVLALLMAAARFLPLEELARLGHQATVSLGFILIFGFLVGHTAKHLGLPGITGYILAGILCGPYFGHLLTAPVVKSLQLVDDLALALIAFTAGGELRLPTLKPRLGSILAINAFQTGLLFVGIAGLSLILFTVAPLGSGAGVSTLAVAMVFGLFAVANSPATCVAVIGETKARGPFTDTVLGVTVLKDVVVLVLITLLLPVILVLSRPGTAFEPSFIGDLAWEVLGSLAGGAVLGGLVTLYMKGSGAVLPLFVAGTALLVTQTARQLHLEPLLLCMVAGFVIENWTSLGDRFIAAIERSALPVYVLFFAVGGASLDLGALRTTGTIALALVVARAGLLRLATGWGERAGGGSHRHVIRWGWTGFLAQAGVTLGLASIVARKFPDWGPEVKTIALAMIALNQLVGPVAFRWALVRSGESGVAAARAETGI
jgi:Kef-type K+ transport system membrane component KefB